MRMNRLSSVGTSSDVTGKVPSICLRWMTPTSCLDSSFSTVLAWNKVLLTVDSGRVKRRDRMTGLHDVSMYVVVTGTGLCWREHRTRALLHRSKPGDCQSDWHLENVCIRLSWEVFGQTWPSGRWSSGDRDCLVPASISRSVRPEIHKDGGRFVWDILTGFYPLTFHNPPPISLQHAIMHKEIHLHFHGAWPILNEIGQAGSHDRKRDWDLQKWPQCEDILSSAS